MSRVPGFTTCDGKNCPAAVPDMEPGDLINCDDCGLDFCPRCASETGHEQTTWADVDQAPALSCPEEVTA